jgi:hypothetical protein
LDGEGSGNFLPLPLRWSIADPVGRRLNPGSRPKGHGNRVRRWVTAGRCTWKFPRHLHPAALAIPHLTQYGRETAAIRSRIAMATLRG